MFKNEYTLSVDLKKKMAKRNPFFIQYDNASLLFKVFDNGKPFNLTGLTRATLTHQFTDGTKIVGEASLVTIDNKQFIQYTYLGNEMDKVGTALVMLSLFSGEQKVSIQSFEIEFIKN